MAERDRAAAAVVDERLRVRPLVRPRRRVPRVADRGLARKGLQLLLVEDVRDEAHLPQDGEVPTLGDRDPRGFLAAVLEREETEVGEPSDVPVGRADSEDAAHG